ncbi:MAG: metallophosphoesterase family protein [Candidatus Omnitrophota bacterium]
MVPIRANNLSSQRLRKKTRIAVLSDIHANAPALEAVLRDLKKYSVDDIWNLGDVLGYGPFPNQAVRSLKEYKAKSIIGNYDLKVLAFRDKQKKWRVSKDPDKYFSFEWMDKHITPATRRYLEGLPSRMVMSVQKQTFLLVHGSPECIDEPLTVSTPLRRFGELAGRVEEGVVLFGHTHCFFEKNAGGVRFINPGSVGRPFDGDARASYVVLEITDGRLTVIPRRLAYPLAKTVGQMRKEGFPERLIRSIAVGKSLDQMDAEEKRAGNRRSPGIGL